MSEFKVVPSENDKFHIERYDPEGVTSLGYVSVTEALELSANLIKALQPVFKMAEKMNNEAKQANSIESVSTVDVLQKIDQEVKATEPKKKRGRPKKNYKGEVMLDSNSKPDATQVEMNFKSSWEH